MQLNYNQLYVFYLCYKHDSFKKASNILNITSPAVSMQIKNLEESLGFNLFVRNKGKNTLSSQAQKILATIEEMFEKSPLLIKQIEEINTQEKIKIGLNFSHHTEFISIIMRYIEKYSLDIDIDFVFAEHDSNIRKLLNKEIDIAFSTRENVDSSLFRQKFLSSKLIYIVCASNPLAQKETISLSELSTIPTIQPPHTSPLYNHLEKYYKEENISFESSSSQHRLVAVHAIKNSPLGGFFPDFRISQSLANNALAEIKLERSPKNFDIYLTCLKSNYKKTAIQKFFKLFEELSKANEYSFEKYIGNL